MGSDLTEKLAAAGVPSVVLTAPGQMAPLEGSDRVLRECIAADAPAILRVLLTERLAEVTDHQLIGLLFDAHNPPVARAALLNLLAPTPGGPS